MFFVDDIILVEESREEMNRKLEMWRQVFESHDFRFSRSKTVFMECKFSKRHIKSSLEVKIGGHIISHTI